MADKVWFITGTSKGFGRVWAEAALARGANGGVRRGARGDGGVPRQQRRSRARASMILATFPLVPCYVCWNRRGEIHMQRFFLGIAITAAVALAPGVSTAKGCLKGAAVGGVVGHVAGHHAVAGAAVGCVVGHHEAKMKQREAAQAAQVQAARAQANAQAAKAQTRTAPSGGVPNQ